MYVVGHQFGEVCGAWCGRGEPVVIGQDVPSIEDLARVAMQRCRDVGLAVQPTPPPGKDLNIEDGRVLSDRCAYAICDLHDVLDAIIAMIDHITRREGRGRIWFRGQGPSYLSNRSEPTGMVRTRIEGREEDDAFGRPHFIPTGDGSRRLLIGAYYFHDHPLMVRPPTLKPPDLLDVEYDGVPLRLLIEQDEMRQRTERPRRRFEPFTAIQSAAVSVHWSAQLRAKVAASTAAEVQRERGRVACDPREPIDLED